MGWEVKIDTSGQSKDCLWVCNVKMKKIFIGAEKHFRGFLDFGVIALSNLKIFHGIRGTHQSICCGHILANIN